MIPKKRLLTVALILAMGLGVWTLAFTFQSATFADGDVLSAAALNSLLNDNFQAASDAVDEKVDRAGDTVTGPLVVDADATASADSTVFSVQNSAATGLAAVFNGTSDDATVGILQEGDGPALALKTSGTGPLIAAPGFVVQADGNVEIAGNVTNGVGSGLPLAFGYVQAGGTLDADGSTSNVSATYNAGLTRYEISIDGESYFHGDYATVVTPIGSAPRFASTGSVGGDLTVYISDSTGTAVQSAFTFAVFKPGG